MAAKKDQSGQALIELVVFLPLMFALYGMISGFAGAINGSINQQKITRAYYYYRIQNNSMVPKAATTVVQNWSRFGMSYVGWADYLKSGDDPVAPCYRISIPLSSSANDTCDNEYDGDNSQFIRVGTVYGICGATFYHSGGGMVYMIPDADGDDPSGLLDEGSCTIQSK